MKTLLLTICTIAALNAQSFAGDFFPYTLEDFNRDQELRAMEAEDAANQRAQELQDKLDEIEAQLEAQNEQPQEAPAQPLTRAQAGFVSLGDHANTARVQTFADDVNAGKAPRAQLVKLPR